MSAVEFNNAGTFEAMRAAEAWLEARGFSVGPSQADGPRAVLYGDFLVAKWRNLSVRERRQVHAIMDDGGREGPARVILMDGATPAARTAFALTDDELGIAAQAATDKKG